MHILIFLIPAALLLGLGFLSLFIWNARSGQYDDFETPAVRILMDQEERK